VKKTFSDLLDAISSKADHSDVLNLTEEGVIQIANQIGVSTRSIKALSSRYGFYGERSHTYAEIGQELTVSPERVRQIVRSVCVTFRRAIRLETKEKIAQSEEKDMRIERCGFSVRTYNCLRKSKLLTLEAIVQCSAADLQMIRNFGRRSLKEVVRVLDERGLKLEEIH